MSLKTCPFCELNFNGDKIGVQNLGIHPVCPEDLDENESSESPNNVKKAAFDCDIRSKTLSGSLGLESGKAHQNCSSKSKTSL